MSIDVRTYLESKGLRVKMAGPNDAHLPCVFCNEPDDKRGRLYVNVGPTDDAGLYFCHLCGAKGNIITLQRHFGDQIDIAPEGTHQRHQILQAAAQFYADNMKQTVLTYLKQDRGLTLETILKHQLGYANGGLYEHLRSAKFDVGDILRTGLCVERNGVVGDFLNDEITIPYHVAGNVVLIRGKKIGGKYRTPPRQDSRLFNSDMTWGAKELVVAEGEFDCMILEQLGYNAVGVAGAKGWQDSFTGYCEDARRVFVVFDNDDAGRSGAERVKDMVGPKVRIVDMPDEGLPPGECDVSEWVVRFGHDREDMDALIHDAVGGLLISVDEAWDEWQNLQGVEGLKFGWEALDSSITPGLLPGQVAILLAKTNTGKTIFLLNLFQRASMIASQDPKILFISLEQTRGDWFERARRIWNFYNLSCPPEDVNKETLNYWRDRLMMVDKNRITEEELISCVEDYEYRMGQKPDLLAVDYLGYWSAAFKGNGRYEQVTNAVMSLKAVGKELRIPIVTPHQVNRIAEEGAELDISSARDSGAVEETGDFVFGLWSEDGKKLMNPDEYTGELGLKIGKSRHGGKGNKIRLVFGKTSLTIVGIEESGLVRRAKHELDWANLKIPWRQGMWRHSQGEYDLGVPVPAHADPDSV